MTTVKEHLSSVANVVVITVFVLGGVDWLTGGFEPLQQASAKALTLEVRSLRTTVEDLQHTIAQMPRPTDFAGQDARIGRGEGQLAALAAQITRDESDARAARIETDAAIQSVKDRVTRLEGGTDTPVRQPHR